MGLYDQHVHSLHSHDSTAEPAECALKARAQGLSGLTFTEHYDYEAYPEEPAHCAYDDDKFTRAIADLRSRFGDSVQIGKGVEVDYQPTNLPRIVDFLQAHSFDLVLLGVHYCRGEAVFDPRVWERSDPVTVTRRYLETVLEAIGACVKLRRGSTPVFDVLAHLDFVKRYSLQFAGADHVEGQEQLLDEILHGCLSAGMTLELNTSTLRKGHAEGMPGTGILRRWAQLGGDAVALGSDSHRVDEVGSDLGRAAQMLLRAGIQQQAIFEKRVCRAVPIADSGAARQQQ